MTFQPRIVLAVMISLVTFSNIDTRHLCPQSTLDHAKYGGLLGRSFEMAEGVNLFVLLPVLADPKD